MARFFGVRDVGLGVLAWYALAHPAVIRFALLFNALTDGGDLMATIIPLVRRHGIDRGALTSASLASVAGVSWVAVWVLATGAIG